MHTEGEIAGAHAQPPAAGIPFALSTMGTPVPFHLLPEVVRAVGADVEVHLDTGIMSGQDIVAAMAHGARFTLIGRAYLYGLMSGGRAGVDRTIEILSGQIERTMRLLGVTSLDELTPEHVVMLRRLAP